MEIEKTKNYYCVIMAGGVGSRFWPISTSKLPKQFHDILGTGKTLIQQTFHRISKIIDKENIYIITNQEYVNITLEQLPNINKDQIIGEPRMMNTAACNIYMAEKIHNLNPKATLVIAPSDHLILDEQSFADNLLKALDLAYENNILVTLGITPTCPNTGYGYIEFDENQIKNGANKVKSFKEKPDLEIAQKFVDSKNFLWNSGIFIWSTNSILSSFKKNLEDMYTVFSSIHNYNTHNEVKEIENAYSKIEKISIDYGILEKSDNVWVIPSSFGWNDLGTWNALYDNFNKNENGNAIHGENIHTYNIHNTIIKSSKKDKIYVIDGLDNYIIVDTDKALLVCPRDNDQSIKDYVDNIKNLEEGKEFI